MKYKLLSLILLIAFLFLLSISFFSNKYAESPDPSPAPYPSPASPAPSPAPGKTIEDIIQEVYKNLKTGKIVIDCPTQMKVDEAEIITTRISKNLKQDLSKGLENILITDILKVGTLMKAVLKGDSFDIKTINNENQPLIPGKITEWKWSVTPKDAGEQSLFLTVSIRILIPELKQEEMMDLNTYVRTIKVAVNPSAFWENNWQLLIENADKLGLAAIGAALLSQWKRLKKWVDDKFNKP